MDWQTITSLVISVLNFFLLIVVYLQVRSARLERLESLWDFLFTTAREETQEMGTAERIADLKCSDQRIRFRRNRHLYLERIEEALHIEKPTISEFWDKMLKGRYRRVQNWYWKALNVYGADPEAFNDVRIWHDPSLGDIDPIALALRLLNSLKAGKKEETEIVKGILNSLCTELKINPAPDARQKAEENVSERLEELRKFGFIRSRTKCSGEWSIRYWELSKRGREVILMQRS